LEANQIRKKVAQDGRPAVMGLPITSYTTDGLLQKTMKKRKAGRGY